MKRFRTYWLLALAATLAASFYPLYMGFRIISDMCTQGVVHAEEYPKYIIPYTPLSLALIFAVACMPLLLKYVKKLPVLTASLLSLVVFFVFELLFELKVIIETNITSYTSTLEDWQMFMCYIPPDTMETRTWTEVNVLMGEYSPTFKLHFYLISIIIIITVINSLYGFGQMIRTKNHARQKALIIQSICTALFLGLCILACFTAFFRDGDILVSPLSASLMGLFFVLMGVTAGTYIGSFCIGKRQLFSIWIPSAAALLTALMMYIGEMFLLDGNLYLLGTGFFFRNIPGIILAPVDILVLLVSAGITMLLCRFFNRKKRT